MPIGGARPGAGRPKGSRQRKQSELAISVAKNGIQPIEVVLNTMRKAWSEGDSKTATDMAAIALPYTTPRLASTVVTNRDGLDDLSIDDLRRLLDAAERNASIASGEGDQPGSICSEDQGEAGATASRNEDQQLRAIH